jgi:hypothetical protein
VLGLPHRLSGLWPILQWSQSFVGPKDRLTENLPSWTRPLDKATIHASALS